MKDLKTKRDTFKQAFDDFMHREHQDDWCPKDDQLLREIAITYIEITCGIDGEPVLEEVLKVAKVLASGLWSKFSDFLEETNLDEFETKYER